MATDVATAAVQRRALGVVWLTVFIDLVGFSIIFPLFPAMLEWYLGREAGSGVVHSLVEALRQLTPAGPHQDLLITVLFGGFLGFLYSLLQFLASPFWGRLSDRHGRRNILLITTTGTALSYLIWVFSGSFWMLLLARLLGGMMAGNIAVATAAVADLTSTANRAKGMALIGVAFGMGFIFGPAIGGIGSLLVLPGSDAFGSAIALNPFSVPAILALILALANVIWVWRVFPKTTTDSASASDSASKPRPLWRLGSDIPNVQRALRVYGLFIIAFAGMEFTLTFLALERLFYSPTEMVRIFLFIGVLLIFTQGVFVRRFAHKIGERNLVTLGLFSCFLGLVSLSNSYAADSFYTGLALLGFGVGCASPALSALVSLYSPPDQQGTQLGAFRSIGALGRAIGPLLAAVAFWQLGSQTAYLAGAVTLFTAAIFSLLLPRHRG